MSEESTDRPAEFRVAAVLATLAAVYAVLFPVLGILLPEKILTEIRFDTESTLVGSIGLLAVSALMAERALAARSARSSPPQSD
jgi:hypothetical protein